MNSKKKILVLDDEGVIRDLLDEVLQEEGYDVITSENPGVAMAKAHKADLVVLDLNISDKDEPQGLDVLIHLWEDKKNNTPIIIFSAYAGFNDTNEVVQDIERIYGNGRKVFASVSKSEGMVKLLSSIGDLFKNNAS